jgi:hypothetical protein
VSTIELTESALTVRWSRLDRVLGLVRDQAVPRASITAVDVVEDGLSAPRGFRAPGLGLPGLRKIGTWRGRGRATLVDVRRGEPALRVHLTGHRYDELLLGTPSAAALADRMRARD